MIMNVRALSGEERTVLLNIIWKEKDTAEFKHAMIIYLSTMGIDVAQIAKFVRFDPQKVMETLESFNDKGLACIHPRYSELPSTLAQPVINIKKDRVVPMG